MCRELNKHRTSLVSTAMLRQFFGKQEFLQGIPHSQAVKKEGKGGFVIFAGIGL